ncbi:MAG: hypothetical protein ACRDFZ_05740 [Candidatus Limnocylindria bacterium]
MTSDMDEQAVRARAQAFCEALRAGDIGRAAEEMSHELRSNLGPLVAMLPLPLTEAVVASVDMTGKGYRAVMRLVGETDTFLLETRWKDRDGRPTIVEASRVHEEPVELEAGSEPGEAQGT